MVSASCRGGPWMVLRDALEVLVGSRSRSSGSCSSVSVRSWPGPRPVRTSWSRAWRPRSGPLLAVAPGPREAEALAADLEAFLGLGRVALLPAWEAALRGHLARPEIAARRASAVARMREAKGAFVLVAPVLAAMQGLIPHRSESAPRAARGRARPAARRARGAPRRPRLRAGRRGRAPRRVRRAGWRGRRVPGHGAAAGPRRLLG